MHHNHTLRHNPWRFAPWLTAATALGGAMLLTLAGGYAAWVASESRHLLQSQKAVLQIQHNLRNQLHTYIAFMRGTSALFAAGDQVTRDEFATYVNVLSLKSQFPGVQAIGYSLRVPAVEREGFDQSERCTLPEAIHACTVAGSEMNGDGRMYGSLEEGSYAEFQLFEDDPMQRSLT